MPSRWEIIEEGLLYRYPYPDGRPLVESMHVKSASGAGLSFQYYDMLAWAVGEQQANNLLLLGLAGGTVLQILAGWGTTPACIGVDLDPDGVTLARSQGWLEYPGLVSVCADARDYLVRSDLPRFDAIVIDVFDETGLVDALYRRPLLDAAARLLEEGGILVLHCGDHGISPFLHNLRPAMPMPSTSLAVARDLAALGFQVTIYPWWAAAALVAWRGEAAPHRPAPLAPSGMSSTAPVAGARRWLARFLQARALGLSHLEARCVPMPTPWSYTRMSAIGGTTAQSLARSFGDEASRTRVADLFRLDLATLGDGPTLFEARPGALVPVTRGTLVGFEALVATATQSPRSAEASAEEALRLRERLPAVLSDSTQNPALAYVASYAMARAGAWDDAVGLLDEVPSLAEIWMW